MCTCARARTHTQTDRQTHAQMPHRRSPSPTRTLSLCCCQIKAWKAGHKGECTVAARADTRTAAKPTADQMRVFNILTKSRNNLKILEQLEDAADWRGVVTQERAARAVAAAVRTSMPSTAAWVYCTLGRAYQNLGNFSKALEHHMEHLTIAKEVGDRAGEGQVYGHLGNAYDSLGDYAKAIERHTQCLAIAKEVGDRAGEGQAYAHLGISYGSLGDFAKAIKYHTQCLMIAKEVGDRAGESGAYGNLGIAYHLLRDFAKAIKYHAQCLAIARELGDRAGEGQAYGNLGNAYDSLGDYAQAIEHHTQDLAIANEVGDRAGEGTAYGNLGNAYHSLGDFAKAIDYHAQHLEIAKELGDRGGEGRAYANLGTCHMHLKEYVRALAYFEAQHSLATSLKLAHVQSDAALNMGVALTLHVRAARQGTATGADQAPGPHSHSSASACLNDSVREAAKWLQAAFDGGSKFAKLHLAHLTFDVGQEDAALAHLKEHLSRCVHLGRYVCAGCGQTRGEDTPMLTCSGCRVARFCNTDHQKMASKKAALGGNLRTGRHKDICGVLSKWREVVKDGVAPESCTADLVAFLQR
jgi:tetratricopeptide (TPR) repeat protein